MSLDLRKVLKGCEGMTFYSLVVGLITLKKIGGGRIYFTCDHSDGRFRFDVCPEGKLNQYGECVVFPSKDQRDWSKFRRRLLIDTPIMVSGDGNNWVLRFYAGNGRMFENGGKSGSGLEMMSGWKYEVPVSEFDFENPESNKDKSI